MGLIVLEVLLALGLGVLFAEILVHSKAQTLLAQQTPALQTTGAQEGPPVPTLVCSDPRSDDQDDMAIWIHPEDPAKSMIIASDKGAKKLIVYDLEGKTLQVIKTPEPGNIDTRYGFPLGKEMVDIVSFNQRERGYEIHVYKIDPETRRLSRIDAGIPTGENYGGTLARSPKTGKFYHVITSKESGCEQYELADDGAGKIKGTRIRRWSLGKCEGAVADDERGKLFIGEEERGVWELGLEPEDPAPGKLVIRLGENGLEGDVEGLAIYYAAGGRGYLLVSNQGANNVKVYDRTTYEYVTTFAIKGAKDTDGLDVVNVPLGPAYPHGLFACHSAKVKRCPVLVTPWERISKSVEPTLRIDTTVSPRK